MTRARKHPSSGVCGNFEGPFLAHVLDGTRAFNPVLVIRHLKNYLVFIFTDKEGKKKQFSDKGRVRNQVS